MLPLTKEQLAIVAEMQEHMGGSELLEFNKPAYRARAEGVYAALGISALTWNNVWDVFQDMLPLMPLQDGDVDFDEDQ